MRYFFHVFLDSGFIRDNEGTELPSEEQAQEEAAAVTSELLWNFSERLTKSAVVEVISEAGKRVIALPVRPGQALAPCR